MKKNDLFMLEDKIIRILETAEDKVLIIDCIKRTVPKWIYISDLVGYETINENTLSEKTNIFPTDIEKMPPDIKSKAYQKYTLIAGVLPFIGDDKERCYAINKVAKQSGVSRQTVIKALYLYLVYQNISVLAPKECSDKRPLTQDEKNIRWALNKFFYTKNQNSLKLAYTFMLKEKYCDDNGKLFEKHPSIYQFRYFYRKHKSMQNFYISRNGLTDYQRNNRPLLGDGVQEFAPNIGVGMLDATVCDIYLVNESGSLVGRPILTTCIDAYSGFCCGYSLTLEGGVYSLRNLMVNILEDKKEHCRKHGIVIKREDWNSDMLPIKLVTDMGKEYVSNTFEQITDLGVTLVNLPPYRPELKGAVEKFFDIIQGLYKPHLKGKGVIEPDFQERGAHDYRKDACLTIREFEKILIYCILYYNNNRIIDNFPYTQKMLTDGVKATASNIWNYSLNCYSSKLIKTDANTVILTLLPRTTGKFSRRGLIVNKLRYKNKNYTDEYLKGDSVIVAYNPENTSNIWLIKDGVYIPFELIEERFKDMDIFEVNDIKDAERNNIKSIKTEDFQARIDLANHIEAVTDMKTSRNYTDIKFIRENRKLEQHRMHNNYIEGVAVNE